MRVGPMRIYLFFAILITGFSLAITAAYKPDAFAAILEDAKKPIRVYKEYQAEKEEKELGIAFQQDKALWMLQHPLPAECNAPKSNLKAVECRNQRDVEVAEFRKLWRQTH
jgi:hypothetical protein